MAETSVWSGKNTKLVFFFRNNKLDLPVQSFSIKREGEKVEEDFCGDDRAELDFITSHYSISITAKLRDLKAVQRFLADQADQDSLTTLEDSAVGFLCYPNDGTSAALQCSQYVLDDWELDVGGRKERNKLTVPGRCRYIDEVASA